MLGQHGCIARYMPSSPPHFHSHHLGNDFDHVQPFLRRQPPFGMRWIVEHERNRCASSAMVLRNATIFRPCRREQSAARFETPTVARPWRVARARAKAARSCGTRRFEMACRLARIFQRAANSRGQTRPPSAHRILPRSRSNKHHSRAPREGSISAASSPKSIESSAFIGNSNVAQLPRIQRGSADASKEWRAFTAKSSNPRQTNRGRKLEDSGEIHLHILSQPPT